MTFKNHFNSTAVKGQINLEPSMTVPGQSMSMSEIIRRFGQGLLPTSTGVEMYDEDPENSILQGINIQTLDLSEIQDLQKFCAQRVKDLRADMKKQRIDAETKKQADEEQAEQKLLEKFQAKKVGDVSQPAQQPNQGKTDQ